MIRSSTPTLSPTREPRNAAAAKSTNRSADLALPTLAPARGSRSHDPVFLGMTRPAMAFGVTYSSFVLNVVVSALVFLFLSDLRGLLVFLPIHAVSVLLCLRDPRIFDLLAVRVLETPPTSNASFFGGASYAP